MRRGERGKGEGEKKRRRREGKREKGRKGKVRGERVLVNCYLSAKTRFEDDCIMT